MKWILLLPVAGLLFLSLAAVDWALYRLEQTDSYQSRWKSFTASGLVLLLVWCGLLIWPTAPTLAQEPVSAGAPTPSFTWQVEAQPSLQLAAALMARTEPPTLAQARADRAALHEARRLLALQPPGTEVAEALMQQADSVLGAAYQALGQQWFLVRQAQWSVQTRQESLNLLQREWERYQALDLCLADGRTDCLPEAPRSERSAVVHAWQRAIRLYLLDCLRFDEQDPDLAWLPAAELHASRDRLSQGRTYLTTHPLPAWGSTITVAADQLFQAADQALILEEISNAQGKWTQGSMARAYQPVQAAWDVLFQETLCAMETEGTCLKTNQ